MAGTKRNRRRYFGTVRKLPSGMYQARYTDPITKRQVSHKETFQTLGDANAWLNQRQTEIRNASWQPEVAKVHARTTLADYAASWLEDRDLTPRTRSEYQRLYDTLIDPELGKLALAAITPERVRTWHNALGKTTGRTSRAHAYALLRTILGTAANDDLIRANPCRIRGAGRVTRAKTIRPATLDELTVIVEAMPERLRLMVLLASWCALRFGEAAELRRKDIDLDAMTLRVRRGVTRVDGEAVVGKPKSVAGSRDVAIPPHLLPVVKDHLERHTGKGRDALLFPAAGGGHMAPSTLYKSWYPARHLAGRDDLRFHDLRHTGAVLAAATGATIAELMARLGHSTPAMAMRYQHAAAERDRVIADALSAMATGK